MERENMKGKYIDLDEHGTCKVTYDGGTYIHFISSIKGGEYYITKSELHQLTK